MDYGDKVNMQLGGPARALSIPGNPVQERIFAVPDAFMYQEARLQDLDAVVEKLFVRLSPVLRPSGPVDPRTEKETPNPVALAGAIHRNSLRLESNCRALTDLLDRLEL